MKVAIVAPSPVPYGIGGAENLWWGMLDALNRRPGIEAELIKIPSPERNLLEIITSYRTFAKLDLDHFDLVISTKYPGWMVRHRNHMVYLQHTLRGLYDTYPSHLSETLKPGMLKRLGLPAKLTDALLNVNPSGMEADEVADMLLTALNNTSDQDALAFPGPFSRAVVHLFDRIGMQPERIRRYAAISREVASRRDYFAADCDIEIYYHPTHLDGIAKAIDQEQPMSEQSQHRQPAIFTASRLVRDKRMDLIVNAYRRSGLKASLRIAGSGSEEHSLRKLAAGLPGVEFLGRLTDEQLRQEYQSAIFVPFAPLHEDYGLITIEAMAFGKPVLTTVDSGGPAEIIEHGVTGLVVEPSIDALAAGMWQLINDEDDRLKMGRAAKTYAERLTWLAFGDWLLNRPVDVAPALLTRERPVLSSPAIARNAYPRMLVINTFPIHPPVSGGQLRLAGLYSGLAGVFDVNFVNLCHSSTQITTRELADGFREHLAPLSPEFLRKLAEIECTLGVSALDLTAALYPQLLPQWLEAIHQEVRKSDLIVCSHPYGYTALEQCRPGSRYLYEAHNVEFDLKAGMYEGEAWAIEAIPRIEGKCASAAMGISTCSPEDARRLAALYELKDDKPISVHPNGVHLQDTPYVNNRQRLAAGAKVGKKFQVGLFMGSAHRPNIVALDAILKAAVRLPDMGFVIMGSVCDTVKDFLPDNVKLLGVVTMEEKKRWLSLADVGLNPVTSGSGTNLKTLEYAASGTLMVATPSGVRGTNMVADEDYLEVDAAATADSLVATLRLHAAMNPSERDVIVRRAYKKVALAADWKTIGQRYATFALGFLRT